VFFFIFFFALDRSRCIPLGHKGLQMQAMVETIAV